MVWSISPGCDGIEEWVQRARDEAAEYMELEADYGSNTDLGPIVTAIAACGVPTLKSLGIHVQSDEAQYPIGDLATLLPALDTLETLDARGTLSTIVGVPTLRTLHLQLTPPSDAACAAFEAASWPAMESLTLHNDARPFPEDYDLRRDAAKLNELDWPKRALPKVTATACPKLKTLELNTGGDALAALQQLAAEPALLDQLDELQVSAGYISADAAQFLLEHASAFANIKDLSIEGVVGWAIGPRLAEQLKAAIPPLYRVQNNIAYEDDTAAGGDADDTQAPQDGEDDEDEEDEEATEERVGGPEVRRLLGYSDAPSVWYASTDQLELSASTTAAIVRMGAEDGFFLGVMGQFSQIRLLSEFGWSRRDVMEMKSLLSQFGIEMGKPFEAWDLEQGRSFDHD